MPWRGWPCLFIGFTLCIICFNPCIADTEINGMVYQWANWNNAGVMNGPPAADIIFTANTPVSVTYLDAYHWNDGQGVSKAGTLTLVSNDGKTYGPFQMTGSAGSGGAPNAIWSLPLAEGALHLPPGTYKVIDSDPDTWSNNPGSGNAGFFGVVWKAQQPDNQAGVNRAGSIWTVKEYGPMGNYGGEWTVHSDGKTLDASWSGGSITDIIDIQSITGDKITLFRHGNQGYYYGTISPDGTTISGTASWYTSGQTWTVSISQPEPGIQKPPLPSVTPVTPSITAAPVATGTTGPQSTDSRDKADEAFVLNAKSEFKKAEEVCNEALTIDPANPSLLSMKGWALLGQGLFEESYAASEASLKINPQNPLALTNAASALSELKRCREAVAVLDYADKIDPWNSINTKIRSMAEKC